MKVITKLCLSIGVLVYAGMIVFVLFSPGPWIVGEGRYGELIKYCGAGVIIFALGGILFLLINKFKKSNRPRANQLSTSDAKKKE